MAATITKPKRKSKGKRHPVYAQSLENIANDLDAGAAYLTAGQLAKIFRDECNRVRGILR